MCIQGKRFFIFFIGWLTVCLVNAQTLYWIGGHGNFNDPAHWSYSPEGVSAQVVPNSNSEAKG